jgi:hypothetical protein
MNAPTQRQRCSGCDRVVEFKVLNVKPIYFGYRVKLVCPKGHHVCQHQREA